MRSNPHGNQDADEVLESTTILKAKTETARNTQKDLENAFYTCHELRNLHRRMKAAAGSPHGAAGQNINE